MPYSITCSTKILTLATAPLLFILVGVHCEFAMVPGVYILLFPQEEEVQFFSWRHRCAHSAAHSSKNLCLPLYYYGKIAVKLEKTQTKSSTVFMVLIIWPNSTLEFLFVFGFNKYLWAIFFLLSFENLVLYLGCGCMMFSFTTRMILHLLSALTHAHEQKSWV